MSSVLPPPDYAALVAAVDHSGEPCTCPYLVRLGMVPRCEGCCQKIVLLADILAAKDTRGVSTVERWMDYRANMEVFRLGEPFR